MQLCRRADLIGKSPEYLYENVTLCSEHFEPSQYYSGGSKRLRRDAVPTLFDVPNPPKPVTSRRPLVVRQDAPAKTTEQGENLEMKAYVYFDFRSPVMPFKVMILMTALTEYGYLIG